MKLTVHDYGAMFVNVLIDGVRDSFCTEADEEAGTVTRLRRDAAGRVICGLDRAETEVVHGSVRIEIAPEFQKEWARVGDAIVRTAPELEDA